MNALPVEIPKRFAVGREHRSRGAAPRRGDVETAHTILLASSVVEFLKVLVLALALLSEVVDGRDGPVHIDGPLLLVLVLYSLPVLEALATVRALRRIGRRRIGEALAITTSLARVQSLRSGLFVVAAFATQNWFPILLGVLSLPWAVAMWRAVHQLRSSVSDDERRRRAPLGVRTVLLASIYLDGMRAPWAIGVLAGAPSPEAGVSGLLCGAILVKLTVTAALLFVLDRGRSRIATALAGAVVAVQLVQTAVLLVRDVPNFAEGAIPAVAVTWIAGTVLWSFLHVAVFVRLLTLDRTDVEVRPA
ncbi:MAG: hypothetical protein R3F34_06555 [Planctomycetota bacterium]